MSKMRKEYDPNKVKRRKRRPIGYYPNSVKT